MNSHADALIEATEAFAKENNIYVTDNAVRTGVGARRGLSTAYRTAGQEVVEIRLKSYGAGSSTDVVTIDRQTARNLAVALIDALTEKDASLEAETAQ